MTIKRITRREAIRGVGSGLIAGGMMSVAGCSGQTIEHRHAEDPWRDSEEDQGTRFQSVAGTVVLPEGRYGIRQLQPPRSIELEISVSVVSGGNIDVFTMETSEFERYRDKEEFLLLRDLSASDTDGATLTAGVTSGDYTISFDNTGYTGASPGGEVRAEYEIIGRL